MDVGSSAERFFHLDGWSGWRFAEASHPGVVVTPEGLMLARGGLPDPARAAVAPAIVRPSGLVFDPHGTKIAIHKNHRSLCFELRCDDEARSCEQPECWMVEPSSDVELLALAISRRGRIFLARSTPGGGEVRVLRFSPAGEIARLRFDRPAALAIGPGDVLYVLERDRREVVLIGPDFAERGRIPIGVDADMLAVSARKTIAVARSSTPMVLISAGGAPFVDAGLTRPVLPAIAFTREDHGVERLDLGDAISRRIVRYHLDGLDGHTLRPDLWSAEVGEFNALAYRGEHLHALEDDCLDRPTTFEEDGFYLRRGVAVFGPLDAHEPNIEWHRILAAIIPEPSTRANVEVEVLAADSCESFDPTDTEEGGPWTAKRGLIAPGAPRVKNSKEVRPSELALVGARGRFAFVRVTLTGNGRKTPLLRWMRVEYPRNSYLRYLPALFSEEAESRDLFGRFLSIFEAENVDQSAVIDGLYRLFRPYSTDPEFLPWLADRLAFLLDPSWPIAKQRRALAEVFDLYRKRGTRWALARYLELYGGEGITIVEGFRTRHNFILGADAVLACRTVLPGSCEAPRMQLDRNLALGAAKLDSRPFVEVDPITENKGELRIYVPARLAQQEGALERIRWIAELEAPAGTFVRVLTIETRAQLGQVGRLGLDASLGRQQRFLLPGSSMLLDREPGTRSDLELGLGNRLGMNSKL